MDLRSDLIQMINLHAHADGIYNTSISGIDCIKFSKPEFLTKRHWRASMSIVVQGCTEIIVGPQVYRYDDIPYYIVIPIDLPVTCRILSATPEKPFLCFKIDFDPLAVAEVAAQLENDYSKEIVNPSHAVFMGKASDQMLEAAIRLSKLFQNPEDARVLGPLVTKEILYHLLKGADGPAIRQFVRLGSKTHKIYQAIYSLKCALDEDVDVMALAKAANMSRSAFFKHFKDVTAMSPIQYKKRLRLLEARRLMMEEGETAESSAFKAGYNSSSQFSREYSRMFGNPPLRDLMKIRVAAKVEKSN